MLFSVLIPLYNAEKYIGDCIESILDQSFSDYEIVIIDDGSKDQSAKVAHQYQKEYPDVIRVLSRDNLGVLLTRRELMKEAKGDYIVWVDSDDLVKPQMLSQLYDEIIKNSPDVLVFDYEELDNPNNISHSLDAPDKYLFEGEEKIKVYRRLLLGRGMNEIVTKCIRRKLIDIDVDYTEFKHVKMGDDLFCLIPILDEATKIEYLNRSYYRVRVVSSSITHTQSYRRYYSYRTIFERESKYLRKWGFSKDEINKIKNKFAYSAIDNLVMCANARGVSKEEFLSFAKDIMSIEENNPIYSDTKRNLGNKPYQSFYDLFTKKQYKKLYRRIGLVNKISRLKHLIRS